MADRRNADNGAAEHVAEVRTAIQFIIKSVDRLEGSVTRLEQTVREDFASTGDLELVKAAVTQLRLDVQRHAQDIEEETDRKFKELTASMDTRFGAAARRRSRETRVARWVIYVAIPSGALALGTLIWEAIKAWVKAKVGGP